MEQIKDNNTIILTNEERDKVLESLDKAHEPNPVLKELLKWCWNKGEADSVQNFKYSCKRGITFR